MHILLVVIGYPPEIRSSSQLTKEFAEELVATGHTVTVLTSYPGYNLSDMQKGADYPMVSVVNGVRIIRVKSLPVHKVSPFRRGIGELSLPFFFSFSALRHIKGKVDGIEVLSPPLTLGIVGGILKWFFRAPLIVNVQDLFPQNAVDLGIIKSRAVLGVFRVIEELVYWFADLITVHSKGNQAFLIDVRKQKASKVLVIPNWIDLAPFTRMQRTGRFRKQYGLENKFIILFAGVLGPAQGLDIVMETAKEVVDLEDLVFLLVGDGTAKSALVGKAAEWNLKNVQFENFVSIDEYPELVKDADVGMLTITHLYHTPVVPGKLLGYMAGGIPTLASLNIESDGHQIVKDADCGISVEAGDLKGFVNAVRRLYKDRHLCARMGENGNRYVRDNFAKERCTALYNNLFLNLLGRSQGK